MGKILRFLKNDWWKIALILALTFAQSMANLYLPAYMSEIVNIGIPTGDTLFILKTGGIMLAVALSGIICQIIARYTSANVSAKFSADLRDAVFTKVECFSLSEFDKFSTASLITRCTNDVSHVQRFFDIILRMAITAPMMSIGGIIMAVRYGQGLSWILVIASIAIVAVMSLNFVFTVPKFNQMQANIDRLNLTAREGLSGIRVIRAFNAQKTQDSKFNDANVTLTKLHLVIGRIMSVLQPLTIFIMNITTVVALWLGASLVAKSSIQVGDLMAFIQYIMQILFSFQMLSMMFIIFPRAMVSVKRINEVLDTQPGIRDPSESDRKSPESTGTIEFRDVTFTYPGALEPALNNISFTAKPDQMTAIIGSTGSGKTTLANLIPRLYDVTKGTVYVDGVDVRQFSTHDLRSRIGYVPQKSMMFSGNIESNISFGRDISHEEVVRSANIAQASDFINETENGFKHSIAQGGVNISGGQKQRLSIARALADSPKIYIFDDSFSSLDFQTESNLKNALAEKTLNSTVILITQRVSTIMNADQIIVLDAGKVVGMGKHNDLLKTCKVYYEIASSQLTKEELV
ncbi:MAG TPA: ABC transporter ATP-binding protein [Clostridia bacterium]|nr:ABC transporter ATP-binding protein [Clostridia bacterium]HQC67890.1 ABC transporter ATP-binding protein [Clostridia bacterium]